jgi:hypothetical protein
MKLPRHISRTRRTAGILLMECLVYISVFAILLGIGTAAFYFCWDHTRAVIFTTNEVASALRAGEHWRADVRAATGEISVITTADGATIEIPAREKKIIYRLAAGELRREIPSQNLSRLVLEKVKASDMKAESRDGVSAWRWELELTPRRKEAHFPLLFMFEAAQPKP